MCAIINLKPTFYINVFTYTFLIQTYSMLNENELCRFPCSQCRKSKLVLKKVADQQQHGFACDECWTTIETRSRCNKCLMQ